MLIPFPPICSSQSDYPEGAAASREPQHMQPAANWRIGDKARLTVFETPVLDHNRLPEINLRRCRQRDTVLQQIDLILRWIKFDLHDLMWQQKVSAASNNYSAASLSPQL
jgi:hypothetical protein